VPKVSERDGLCGICPAGCWVRATVVGERLTGVEALPNHPLGAICTIGRHSPAIVHDPDRLQYPMRRVGNRGEAKFERIGWDEAFELLTTNLLQIKDRLGPEACAIYTGRGSFDMALCDIFQPAGVAVSSASSVLFPFGSPNTLGVGALCYVSFAMIAPHVTMGEMLITMDSDIDQAELIVIWGANPATDSPPLAHEKILRARARGVEVVVIDPRRHETARQVEAEWVPIRPGTDGALALGMIGVLLEEELFDAAFARDWTVGFAELSSLCGHYRPEVVEAITGVPAATVRRLARRIAGARGACPVMYTGLEYSDSGVQAIRAVFTLWALAGQLDIPGGLLFRMKENTFPQNRSGLIANPDVRKALARERFPIYSAYRGESHAIALPEAVLEGRPYPLKALLVLGGSLITAWPNPALWRQTLNALDFLAVIDRYPTADSAYADLVLPAATGYEITSYMRYGPLFKIRERLLSPVGEARSDYLILAELARRLGYGQLYPQTEEAMLRHVLAGSGFTLEEVRASGGSVQVPTVIQQYRKWEKGLLREDRQSGFNTPSGKFEIASSILAEHGYPPLPVYTEPREGPRAAAELSRRFPLAFNSGSRTRYDFRSQHHGVRGLAEQHAEPRVTINTCDAAERGIADGDRVWLETPRGRLLFAARVTADIVAGAIDADMGGGGPLGPAEWRDCNVNELTDLQNFDPISGFPVYKTLLCQVQLATAADKVRSADEETSPVVRPAAPAVRRIYLDHNATTPIDNEVLTAMLPFLREEWGNPSSLHTPGSRAQAALEQARRQVAQALNCTARRLIFTSGGSEAINLAVRGLAAADRSGRKHLITSAVEHPASMAACRALVRHGYRLTILPVDMDGCVHTESLRQVLRPDTLLVSIMLANNESGALQPIAELAALAHTHGALFHVDAVQALGKMALDVEELGVDLLSVSAHKVHGPKGVGALYRRQGVELEALIAGGDQEQGLRAGTENVAGIVGFGKACELAQWRLRQGRLVEVAELRDRLEQGIMELLPAARRNGPARKRLPNTLNMTLPGIRGESLVLHLDRWGICFSSGSACKSGRPEPSAALLAMGLSQEEAHCAVRFSLGCGNTAEEIDATLNALEEVLRETGEQVRFSSCR
jgi:cysteine desulfurase NifS